MTRVEHLTVLLIAAGLCVACAIGWGWGYLVARSDHKAAELAKRETCWMGSMREYGRIGD